MSVLGGGSAVGLAVATEEGSMPALAWLWRPLLLLLLTMSLV